MDTFCFKPQQPSAHRWPCCPLPPVQAAYLSQRVVFLVLFLVVCSALDALFTILHIQQGASEINPLMAMALSQGVAPFVSAKMSLTGLGAVLLAMYRNFRFGLKSLQGLAVIYGVLLVYHLWIFTQTASP